MDNIAVKNEMDEKAIRKKCMVDFPYYAAKALKIRTKKDGVTPLILNDAQMHLHQQAEQMFKEKGYIRIIVLKGRQQGASTYIEGRFYWKVTHQKGVRAFILTHEGEATSNLFGLAKRYHEHMNPLLRPQTDKDSGNELNFNLLDSGYKVGTAGSKDVGRSSTVQYFHGSEVSFWPNAQDHARGVMQAVPKGSGEIWLESTSDGIGNYFYQVWRLAEQGENEFLPVFIPWFWQSEYSIASPDFIIDEQEVEYAELIRNYHGYDITNEQLQFRRDKIKGDFGGEVEAFKREYPATPQEAFESAGIAQFIPGETANRAFAAKTSLKPSGAKVLGVDCARFGNDRTVIFERQGRVARKIKTLFKAGQMEIVGHIKALLKSTHYDRVFIDVGMGVGVIDRLHEMGYDQVQAVDFGSKAFVSDRYVNKRNEMYGECLEWMEDGPVWIIDENEDGSPCDETLTDLCSVHYRLDSNNRKVLEKKEDTKKRLGSSPDSGDGLVLTFAEPVAATYDEDDDLDGWGRDQQLQNHENAMGY